MIAKIKNLTNNSVKTVIDVKDNHLILSDYGQLPISNLTNYVVIEGSLAVMENNNVNVNANAYVNTNAYANTNVNIINPNDTYINPDTFFENSYTGLANTLINAVEKPQNIQDSTNISVVSKYVKPDEKGITEIPYNPNLLSEQTRNNLEQYSYEDNFLDSILPETSDTVSIKQIENKSNNLEEKYKNEFIAGNITKEEYNELKKYNFDALLVMKNKKNEKTSIPKLRKTVKTELNISFTTMLPKLEDIKNINDLFDGYNIIEELAKEIADEYVKNPVLLEDLFIGAIENIIKKKKTTRTTTKKRS